MTTAITVQTEHGDLFIVGAVAVPRPDFFYLILF